jgi:hypothetical protein
MKSILEKIVSFYLNGFRSMRLGRTLWAIILLKLFILFGVVKLFFFPDYLDTRFTTDDQKADYVLTELTSMAGPERPASTNYESWSFQLPEVQGSESPSYIISAPK